MMKALPLLLTYLFAAPLAGALLAGFDRKLSAKLQGRVGPPLLQPIYDVAKLLEKENVVVRRSQNFYITYYLMLVIFTGALFFTGNDMLLVIFAFTLACVFFVLAAYKASSPYSFIGAQRELLQIMAYEPAIILSVIGMYMVTGTFRVEDIVHYGRLLVLPLAGVFLSYVYILAIKLRKSPFDLSTSHHAHQELVKGITTEFSGRALAMIEVAHWYETVFVLGIAYLFFARYTALAVFMSLALYVMVVFIDNMIARVKWQFALASSWVVAFVFGTGNIIWLFVMRSR